MQKSASASFTISLLIFVFSIACFSGNAYGAYYDGSNNGDSWETAYIIASPEDLRLMRDRVNSGDEPGGKYYKLNADIDISSETKWRGIGYENPFTGHFDGQNHTISLNIDDESSYNAGLFSVTQGDAVIRNLNITGTVKGSWVGCLTWGFNSGLIENCSFSGTAEAYTDWAGGLVDLMNGGTIRNCKMNAKIITPTHSAGGFVAELYDGNIEGCSISGSEISGYAYAGGVVGLMHGGYVNTCTADVTLSNASSRGGIVGGATTAVQNNLSGNTWPNAYPQIGMVSDYLDMPVTSQDAYSELHQAVISPVVLSSDVIARLANNISVDPSAINLLTSADFDPSDPPEPTESMRQEVANQNGQFMAKMNTVKVNKDGWYVFMVTVSDDLVGTPVGDFRLYSAEESEFSGAFRASFGLMPIVNGVTGGLEITNLFGVKLDTMPKQFLATIMLTAGKSLTTYIVKILIMFLVAGCDSGIGIGVACIAAGLVAVKFFRRKR